jgi:gamma-glutamyltranspeptidase / glutathione hydrolase
MREIFMRGRPTSATLDMPGGRIPEAGTLVRNETLAQTWRRIVQESESVRGNREVRTEAAPNAFYWGFVAEELHLFVRQNEVMDESGTAHRGVINGDDLANGEAIYETPTAYDYKGFKVHKIEPWGRGPVFLQALALLKGFNQSAMDQRVGAFILTVVEAIKLAFADRKHYSGGPDFVEVPIAELLSDAYNGERQKLISERASSDLTPGVVRGYETEIARMGEAL